MKSITYVTGNPGKFDEVSHFIAEQAPHINLVQFDCDLPELQSSDQHAIALQKAYHAWSILKKPLLVDDSGIYFEEYNEFPGTMTKFVFDGIGFDGIHALTAVNNKAFFKLHLVYIDESGTAHVFESRVYGTIVRPTDYYFQPGFPYNAIFKPEGSDVTYAQSYSSSTPETYSYRIKAVAAFLDWLSSNAAN